MPLTRFTPTDITINGVSLVGLRPLKRSTAASAFAVTGGKTLGTGATGSASGNFHNYIICYRHLVGSHEVWSHTNLGVTTSNPVLPLPPLTDTSQQVIT